MLRASSTLHVMPCARASTSPSPGCCFCNNWARFPYYTNHALFVLNRGQVALDIEHSKYLGGDLQHTHLVKGLDYALLNKVRSETEVETGTAAPPLTNRVAGSERNSGSVANEAAAGSLPASNMPAPPVHGFHTRLGHAIHRIVAEQEASDGSRVTERFLPGRTVFTFSLDATSHALDEIPIIAQRSKEDCAAVADMLNDVVDDAMLRRLRSILDAMRQVGWRGVVCAHPRVTPTNLNCHWVLFVRTPWHPHVHSDRPGALYITCGVVGGTPRPAQKEVKGG